MFRIYLFVHLIQILFKIFLIANAIDSTSSKLLGEFAYEEGEWEKMIIDLITREMSQLPIEDFVDHPELLQKVDRINKLSVYKKLQSVKGEALTADQEENLIIYRRKSVDSKLPIVVLRSNEDHLKVFERKRTFVVLRQNPVTNNTYFASYVYLRFWTDRQQGCTETYLNEKICLEWDIWDNDRGEIKTKQKYFGWTDCASSFLFSCRFETPSESSANASTTLGLVERGYRNATMNYEQANETKLFFIPAKGLPFDDTIDAFFDLMTTPGEGHYIWETIRHTSIFNHPTGFVGIGSAAISGRSLGASEDIKAMAEKLKDAKEKAKVDLEVKSKSKATLHKKLESKNEWTRRKNNLNTLIRAYAAELGFDQFYKIKNDSKKLEKLKSYKNASEVLRELEALGDKFNLNQVDGSVVNSRGAGEATLLRRADEEPEEDSKDEANIASAFGMSISSIVIKSGRGGMSGRSIGELDSKVAESIAKSVLFSSTDTFQLPGWKLQGIDSNWKPNNTLELESLIFYGLGSCAYKIPENITLTKNVTNTSKLASKFVSVNDFKAKNEKVINFFLTLFKTYCLKEAKEYLQYLIQEKYLAIKGNYFTVPKELFQSAKTKLRTNEFRKLSAALEIASFSQNYDEEVKHDWNWKTAGISRSIHYLQEFGYVFITQARQSMDPHFIKLCRNLVLTYKGVLTKLIQDNEILLAKCDKNDKESCEWNLKLNYNDRLAIHSFMEFLTRGLAPVEQDSKTLVEKIYKNFVQRNQQSLKDGIEF